jgi:hypothetical protein
MGNFSFHPAKNAEPLVVDVAGVVHLAADGTVDYSEGKGFTAAQSGTTAGTYLITLTDTTSRIRGVVVGAREASGKLLIAQVKGVATGVITVLVWDAGANTGSAAEHALYTCDAAVIIDFIAKVTVDK